MKEFNWEDFKNKDIAVHCKTENEAKDFIGKCYEHEIMWSDKNINKTNWDFKTKNTCYDFCQYNNALAYAIKSYYIQNKYVILEWSDYYMNTKKERVQQDIHQKFTKDMLEDFMVVELRDWSLGIIFKGNILYDNSWDDLSYWNDNLIHFDNGLNNPDYDIIKIYILSDKIHSINDILNKDKLKLIWELQEVKEEQAIIETNKFENISDEELLAEINRRFLNK